MRIFAAIPLPDYVLSELAMIFSPMDHAKWVEDGHYHITLEFFGEVSKRDLEELADNLQRLDWSSFKISLQGVGYFGSSKTPRVLYAGVTEDEEMHSLQHKIHRVGKELGLEVEERKFKPHVTLARLKGTPYEQVGPFIAQYSLLRTKPFEVSHFHLFRSHLGGTSAHYEILETIHSKES